TSCPVPVSTRLVSNRTTPGVDDGFSMTVTACPIACRSLPVGPHGGRNTAPPVLDDGRLLATGHPPGRRGEHDRQHPEGDVHELEPELVVGRRDLGAPHEPHERGPPRRGLPQPHLAG